MQQTLQLTNIGPHADLKCELEPGLNVFVGDCGTGKSTALDALGYIAGGDGYRLTVRDGSGQSGTIEAFGVTAKICRRSETPTSDREGRNPAVRGVMTVTAIQGVNIMDLIDPTGVDPEVRDGARLGLALRLAGVDVTPDLFFDADPLVRPNVTAKTLKLSSLPEMARAMRRDIQSAANEVEKEAARLEGEMQAHLSASGGVDGAEPEAKANHAAEVTAAIRELDALRAKCEQARKLGEQAAKSREDLERARTSYSGPTIEQARAAIAETQATVDRITDEIQRMQSTLADERTALSGLRIQLQAAEAHESNLKRWSDSIAAGETAVSVDAGDLERAEQRVAAAQAAQSEDAVLSEKRKRRREADALTAKIDKENARATGLRSAADKLESVLTDALNASRCGLSWKEGRITFVDSARGEMFFDDASHGQRTTLAIRMLLAAFKGEPAFAVVPQEVFEGLPSDRQEELHRIACESGVYLVTARAKKSRLELVHGPVAEG